MKLIEKNRCRILPGIICFAALLFGVAEAFFFSSQAETDNVWPLLMLAALLIYDGLKLINFESGVKYYKAGRFASWILLFASAVSMLLPGGNLGLNTNFALLLLTSAFLIFHCGIMAEIHLAVPLVISFLIIPFQEILALSFSYPLRLFSTVISVKILKWCGAEISYHGTSVTLGKTELAITDACSGISQLAVLLFLGWILVKLRHDRLVWRLLHYSFLLPVIIVANAARLVLTILLYYQFGDVVFESRYHMAFGYFFVVLSLVLLWAGGGFFPDQEEEPHADKN